jgi:hypothetical protein
MNSSDHGRFLFLVAIASSSLNEIAIDNRDLLIAPWTIAENVRLYLEWTSLSTTPVVEPTLPPPLLRHDGTRIKNNGSRSLREFFNRTTGAQSNFS